MMWSGVLASLLFVGAESSSSKPDVIQLPVGFFPEGITIAKKSTAYVGSLVGERAICLGAACRCTFWLKTIPLLKRGYV